MFTREQFFEEMAKIRKALPRLREMGPLRMEHPIPGNPDIIVTADDTEQMLNEMENMMRAAIHMPDAGSA